MQKTIRIILDEQSKAIKEIDKFRESLKGRKINLQKLLQESKKDLKWIFLINWGTFENFRG